VVELPTVTVWNSLVLNPSFEDSAPGTNAIPAWSGGSGVNNWSGPALDNGRIPDQVQVAVLQGSNRLSQQIYGLAPGKNYWLQFRYNPSFVASQAGAYGIDLKVKLGGSILAAIPNIAPPGLYALDVPFYFTNIVFVPTNASELLEFDTLPTVPNTTPALLLDAVSMVQRDADEIVIENPSFEASGQTSDNSFTAPMAGWSVTGGYGINFSPGDTFGDNGKAPDQGEVLFMWHACTASNLISGLTVGQAYTLSYGVNARGEPGGSVLTYDVAFGDIPLLTGQQVNPVGDDNPYVTQYLTFTNDSTSGVLGFATYNVGDTTTLLDNIRLAPGLRVPPQLVYESPAPGGNAASQPALQFVITQGSYPLDAGTLELLLNGANVAAKATVTTTNNPPGIVVTYAAPVLRPGTNSVELIVSDKNSPPMTLDTAYTFVALPPPALSVSQSGGLVIITWPVSATGYVLQETSALPGGWTNSTATATVQGSQNMVDIAPTGKSKFYRLGQ